MCRPPSCHYHIPTDHRLSTHRPPATFHRGAATRALVKPRERSVKPSRMHGRHILRQSDQSTISPWPYCARQVGRHVRQSSPTPWRLDLVYRQPQPDPGQPTQRALRRWPRQSPQSAAAALAHLSCLTAQRRLCTTKDQRWPAPEHCEPAATRAAADTASSQSIRDGSQLSCEERAAHKD